MIFLQIAGIWVVMALTYNYIAIYPGWAIFGLAVLTFVCSEIEERVMQHSGTESQEERLAWELLDNVDETESIWKLMSCETIAQQQVEIAAE